MAKIKICGLRSEQDIKYANELKPDYVGFILSQGFKRSISQSKAKALRQQLSDKITAVGVFVNETINRVNTIIDSRIVDVVQLHGDESPEYCASINVPVIKMLRPDNFNRVKEYEPFVDYFLFDSGTGTGKKFNWSKIPVTKKPFFLAGGLNRDNLNKAIVSVHPFAVDMSSSVETDGVKDYGKIKEVIDIVRSSDE